MKNPLKYRPLVNQVELNYWNPQPHLVAVRVATSYSWQPCSAGTCHSVGKVTKGAVRSLFTVRRHVESQGNVGVANCRVCFALPRQN